jgi:hypothetical protein
LFVSQIWKSANGEDFQQVSADTPVR